MNCLFCHSPLISGTFFTYPKECPEYPNCPHHTSFNNDINKTLWVAFFLPDCHLEICILNDSPLTYGKGYLMDYCRPWVNNSLPFIPDDLSPNNVAHFVERLNNLQAFQ